MADDDEKPLSKARRMDRLMRAADEPVRAPGPSGGNGPFPRGQAPKNPDDPRYMKQRCSESNKDGSPCARWAIRGGTVCQTHGGRVTKVRQKALVRSEIHRWGITEEHTDPAELLLRLVSQSARRADEYGNALGEIVDEHGLQAALVGEVRIPTESGSYISGEYVKGLALLEKEERDRAANFATKAIAAGLARRQVELAEQHGALIAEVLRKVFGDPELGLSTEQRQVLPALLRRHQPLAG